MALLCTFLAEVGYNVTLVTYSDVKDHYSLSNNIKRINLGAGKKPLRKLFAIFKYFLKTNTDCIISYRQACNTRVLLPLLFKKNIRLICSERNIHYGHNDKYELVLFGGLYKRADLIVTNSYSQERYIKRIRPKWSNKVRTIINYTDINIYKSVVLPSDMSIFKIAVFSRVAYQKNVKNFIKAIALLKQNSSKMFEIHWYGNKEPDCPYQSWNAEYGTEGLLFFHDAVKNPQNLMYIYHAVCLPSLFEGFSNSIAEAICCGMPMIVGDVSDNSIMVKNEENGFLFDPTNIEDISNCISKIMNLSYEELCMMGNKSRIIAESLFNKEIFVSSYINIIEGLQR